ncbi:MAG: hypothetical protein RLZZ219_129 [Cyanobacteriota bacterium]|jgi:hypothetical protein
MRGRPAVRRLRRAPAPSIAGLLALVALVTACRSSEPATPLCYEQRGGQAESPSIEQLRLDRAGDQISGFYRWIPWQKDRRIGTLSGRVSSAGTAQVDYRFSQEGQQARAPLTIVFDAQRAVIRWDQPQQPMPPVELPARACAELTAVPDL